MLPPVNVIHNLWRCRFGVAIIKCACLGEKFVIVSWYSVRYHPQAIFPRFSVNRGLFQISGISTANSVRGETLLSRKSPRHDGRSGAAISRNALSGGRTSSIIDSVDKKKYHTWWRWEKVLMILFKATNRSLWPVLSSMRDFIESYNKNWIIRAHTMEIFQCSPQR